MSNDVSRRPEDETENTDAELADVLDAYLAAVEAGNPVDPEQVLAEHPTIASRLRVCLAGLGLVEQQGHALRGDSEQPEPPPHELGDYRLLRELGRGGMGIVYEAEQVSLRRRVALKVLPFAATLDPRQLQRFQAEARAAGLLNHPNIVPVYAVGCEQGVYFYVMQLIEGRTLAALIEEMRHPIPTPSATSATQQLRGLRTLSATPSIPVSATRVRELIALGIQAAEALEHAHQFGIIHRDIKPGNLLMDEHGRLWVGDFGLALFTPDQRLTQTGDIVGTLRYMSPEQARAQRGLVDHRTDVYALGATLYELLTLQPLFTGSDAQALLMQITFQEPTPPRRINPAIAPELETILLKAVAKSIEERYASSQELADDLRNFLEDRPIRARPPTLSQQLTRWARRHSRVVAGGLLLLVVAVIGLAVTATVVGWALGDRTQALNQLRAEKTRTDAALARERRNAARYLSTLAAQDWERGKVDRVLELLNDCPEEARHWEWRYLMRQCHRDLLAFPRQADMIYSLDLSPDGTLLATACRDGSVRLWDTTTGAEVRRLPDLTKLAAKVVFSPDGIRLAVSGAFGLIRVHRVADGQLLAELTRSNGIIWGLAWHPNGRLLAAATGTGATVWDVDQRTVTRELPVTDKDTRGVAFGVAAGRVFLAASSRSGVVKVWDAATWEERFTRKYADAESGLAFSPDGRRLAIPSGRNVELLTIPEGQSFRPLRGHTETVFSATFSTDGRWIATAGLDRSVRIWDAANGAPVRRYRGHADGVHEARFSRDGRRIATASLDRTAKLWDATTEQESLPALVHEGTVRGVAFSNDSRVLATTGVDREVRLWDARQGKLLRVLSGHTEFVRCLVFVAGGRQLASGGRDGSIRIWDVESAAVVHRIANENNIVTLSTDASGRLLASAANRDPVLGVISTEIKLWDVERGVLIAHYLGPFTPSDWGLSGISAALSPDGKWLAWPELGSVITVREAATGREVLRCRGSYPLGGQVIFSPDGRHLAATGSKESVHDACVWEATPGSAVEERDPVRVLRGHTSGVNALAFSGDGQRLATVATDRTVRLWDLETGWEVLTLSGDGFGMEAVAFSPDGTRLAAGTGSRLARIWDASPLDSAPRAVPHGGQ